MHYKGRKDAQNNYVSEKYTKIIKLVINTYGASRLHNVWHGPELTDVLPLEGSYIEYVV